MKILFITTSFNGLSQRAWIELDRLNHDVKVHIVSSSEKMIEVVDAYKPELIVAPYLKKAIPEVIWKNYTCLIVHPGIIGDRGSCSLDWAILNKEEVWGVTILQAAEKMDAGTVWATSNFAMQDVSKSFLYRHEVTQAAIDALLKAVHNFEEKKFPSDEIVILGIESKKQGKWNRATNQSDFKFSWNDDVKTIIRKINAADSAPGVLCSFFNGEYFCFGAVEESLLKGKSGEIIAKRNGAVCVGTIDNAVWIRCLKKNEEGAIKLPATIVLDEKINDIAESPINIFEDDLSIKTFREIWYEEKNNVGYLNFDFYNGATGTDQCNRLREAFIEVKKRNIKVIVLMGGADTWSNGIHLNVIEASENPAQESWENINAIDDLIKEIICTDTHYVISALQGNAGAGGVSLAISTDKFIAQKGIILNPHTRNMGLYGSEYWTYLLPKRIGTERANLFTEQCLPWGTAIAMEVKLIDVCLEETGNSFREKVKTIAEEVAGLSYFPQLMTGKKFKRQRDERYKPLAKYREEELEKMHKNFFDDDLGYDLKRYQFVHKVNVNEKASSITEKDLFSERRKIWRRRKYEKLQYEV